MKQVLKIKETWTIFKSTLGNEQPFAIDVKGGGKESNKKKGPKKASRESVLPLMPKGETVGNVVIDGKGNGKEGTHETKEK